MGIAPEPKSKFPIVFGACLCGSRERFEGARVESLEEAIVLYDLFLSYGHKDIDTARIYSAGSSEEYLAAADWKGRGLNVRDKLYPTKGKPLGHLGPAYTFEPADVRRGLMDCLDALKTDKLDIFILYAPDRKTPIEDTLREVNKLHEEGYFNRLGIANYMSWEVAQVCETCDRHGWIKPSIYQSLYNLLNRAIEPELIPCLRAYGLALHTGQPLAGGFLTTQYTRDFTEHEAGSRFDPKCYHGRHHRQRYWNDTNFDALDMIRTVAKKHGLTEIQCAMRWLSHHSLLDKERGDAIIICPVTPDQMKEDMAALEQGPLPEEVVQTLNAAYLKVRGVVGPYNH